MNSKIIFVGRYLIVLTILALLLEGISFTFWESWGGQRIKYHLKIDLPDDINRSSDSDFHKYAKTFDPELGWNYQANYVNPSPRSLNRPEPDGSRLNPTQYRRKLISAYGDSFVFGAETGDRETFEYHLSEITKSNVANYGVSGYGPDQGVLLMDRNINHGLGTPILLLGMPSENIARIVNIFPALYWSGGTSRIVVKPIFRADTENPVVLKLGLETLPTRRQLIELTEVARRHDFWWQVNERRFRKEFPYAYMTFNAALYFIRGAMRWQNLYEIQQATQTLHSILEKFVEVAEQNNSWPVFVMIPMPQDILRTHNGEKPHYNLFLEELRQQYGTRLGIVDALDYGTDHERFFVRPDLAGHPSNYGHSVIAARIYNVISDRLGRLK